MSYSPSSLASAAHLFGAELRLARQAQGWSLAQLCEQFTARGRIAHRGYVGHVEVGDRFPEDRQFAELADDILGTRGLLTRLWDFAHAARAAASSQARGNRLAAVDFATRSVTPVITGDIVLVPYEINPGTVAYMQMTRRAFLASGGVVASGVVTADPSASATAPTRQEFARETSLAQSIASELQGGHAGSLAADQTSHQIDLRIASYLRSGGWSERDLRSWMYQDPHPVLRVNATGIAAKMLGTQMPEQAVAVLAQDQQVRELYASAVLARLYGVDAAIARSWLQPQELPAHLTRDWVDRLGIELNYQHDVGARWCAAWALAGVRAADDHPAGAAATALLEAALADEEIPVLRQAYGQALSGSLAS